MRRIKKAIIIAILLLVSSTASAYDFTYKWNSWSINDNLKNKVDLLIERKMQSGETRLRYFNLLQKYDISKYTEIKKWILNYLIAKLDPYKKNFSENLTRVKTPLVVSTVSDTNSVTVQQPVFTPIVGPKNNVQDWPRIFTYTYSNDAEKKYIETLKKSVKEYVELNNDYEFTEYSNTFRLNLNEYYKISTDNPLEAYKRIPTISREILYKKWWSYYVTSSWYSIEKKKTIKDIAAAVKFSWESEDTVVFNVRDWYYHAYWLYNIDYYTIPEDGMYLSQYKGLSSINNVILLKKSGKYLLITKFTESKLFPVQFLSKIKNPLEILNAVWRDMYFYKWTDFESTMQSISTKTAEITNWLTSDEEKIKAIYSWITGNLKYDEYSKTFIEWKITEDKYLEWVDKNVFTWLWSFKSRNAVCDWYTKLFLYMLSFAGIDWISTEIWTVSQWWRTISHAWNRINDKLYDTTWDINSLGNPAKFNWYGLTQDEMYKTHVKK
ncbi:MAG: hypothetical protein ACD_3C00111G0025 [uncultured bacterium (gcode 4)]|uniref:Transglutaminase-like domain-containing protein n=1 Tax=uncultured bacterium (gcode 4) TaxID=1234023 RepID=K2FYI7_9BACT|nr:MAG: hypothetical protein ACD_3C00111G0025 [uncultured bacterium (gcode 4)]